MPGVAAWDLETAGGSIIAHLQQLETLHGLGARGERVLKMSTHAIALLRQPLGQQECIICDVEQLRVATGWLECVLARQASCKKCNR